MAQLTVRKVDDHIVKALRKRAAEHGRSVEAEHRQILRAALTDGEASFVERAASLRKRLRSTTDSTEIIRDARCRVPLLPVRDPDAIVTLENVNALRDKLP